MKQTGKDKVDIVVSKLIDTLPIKLSKELVIQIFKFLIVGGIATIIDWFVYYILYNFLGVNPLVANVVSFVVSVIYNYIASVKWIFNVDKEKSKKRIFIEFIVLSTIGLAITEVLLYLFISISMHKMLAKIIATAIVMVFNFITRKIFLENSKIKLDERIYSVIDIIFSYLFVLGVNYYFFRDNILGRQTIFNIFMFFLCFNLYKNNSKKQDKKIPMILAGILSLALVIGNVVYKYNDISSLISSKREIILAIITFISFTKFIGEILYIVFEKITKHNFKSKKMWRLFENKYIFIILWVVIFLSWVPTFLAYYPGINTYDSEVQTNYVFTQYTKFHPPIHTFIWGLCINIGNKIGIEPISIYAVTQMLLLSFVFAKMLKFMINRKTNNWIILVSLLFLSINPFISVFSIIMTKDIYFGMLFVLLILEILEFVTNPDKYFNSPLSWVKFIAFNLLACLFRNNAIYVIIIYTAIVIIAMRKYWKKCIPLFIIPIVLYYLVDVKLYNMLGIKPGNSREMFSVPIQQISYTVLKNNDSLDEQTKNEIDKFIKYDKVFTDYNPRWADLMKKTFKTKYFNEHKKEFIELWLKLLVKYPDEYISSFLTLNIPYWYPDSNSIDEYSQRRYIETHMIHNKYYEPVRDSKLPWLLEKLEDITSIEPIEKKPIIFNIFSLSTPIWAIMFTIFICLYKKHYNKILVLLPLLLLWLTYMLGPVSNFRYVFPLVILYPLLLFLITSDKIECE